MPLVLWIIAFNLILSAGMLLTHAGQNRSKITTPGWCAINALEAIGLVVWLLVVFL
jgi:hypothetical protein